MSDTESMACSFNDAALALGETAAILAPKIAREFSVTVVHRFANKEIETSVRVMPAKRGAE